MELKQSTAAILSESRAPLVVDDIDLPDHLEVGQVFVEVLYTTICGAQLNEIAALKGPDRFLPHLLGHEALARVVEIGPGVSHVAPGDQVVLHWRPSQGIQCQPPSYRWRGRELNAGWVTTFNRHAVVSENRMTLLPAGFDPKVAPLLGCAVTTAAGVVVNDARVGLGEAVVVFGTGGVGLNVVQFAHLAGAHPVVAVDLVADKLSAALCRGASHAVDGSDPARTATELRDIVGPAGADKVIETTGAKAVIELAYDLTAPDGTCVLVGVPSEKVSIYTLPLHFDKVLTGSHGGDSIPHRDIPRLVRLSQAGRFSLEGIITHQFPLREINTALDLVRSGTAGRVLLDLGAG